MRKLSDGDIQRILVLLKEGKPLPEDYKSILFDAKKECELMYADKEREQDILADTMAVPLQKVKTFRNGRKTNGWTNMLIFGDNLQILKELLDWKRRGWLKNGDGTPGVRLVYIDPPFATRQEFRGSQDQKAYQDKIAGARFLEFLRKRLIFLRELLSEDGSIYVHLDWKKIHYVKIMLDEIFREERFRGEIIWHLGSIAGSAKGFPRAHETILIYSKKEDFFIQEQRKPFSKKLLASLKQDEDGWYYTRGSRSGRRELAEWEKESRVGLKTYVDPKKGGTKVNDVWDDIGGYNMGSDEKTGYPTQKPERLLKRVVCAGCKPGDLVLDCFAGSGTALVVAEKMGRRWIGVDCGKLAIYTMQKRLLNTAEGKDLENPKRKYGKPSKPFTLCNAGLYDYKNIRELPWGQYRDFALKLFQCRDEKHEVSKIELDGFLGADNVLVFNYQKHKDAVMDRGFIDDLHGHLEDKIGRRFFIIAPTASVQFLEDYIEKGKTKYFILRIPYSIIEEIHKQGFTKIRQPMSEMDVNDTVDAVGFDFIQVPTMECKYLLDKPKKPDLLNQKTKECVIKIEKFESKVITRRPIEFGNLETLSMVMLDYDFNGEVFDLDDVFYAEELKKNAYEVRFAKDRIKKQMMIIYIDIFGNEKREIKTLSDFNKKRR